MQKKPYSNIEEIIDFQNVTQIQVINQSSTGEVENEQMKKLLNTLVEEIPPPKSKLNLDSFQFDSTLKKRKKLSTKYCNIQVKTRNLLTNVSYRRYRPRGIEKTNFAVDVFFILDAKFKPNWSRKET